MEIMKSNWKPKKIQIPIRRSSSSNSESLSHFESPHSPLRFESPLRSDLGDPPGSTYSSPIASPEKPRPPLQNSVAVVATDKSTQYSPALSPIPPDNLQAPPHGMPDLVLNRNSKDDATDARVMKVKLEEMPMASVTRKSGKEEKMKIGELGFRLSEIVLCLISFSVMAADKTKGWSGDSFDRYKEYRYCLAVNVIGFVYAGFQAYDLSYHIATGKHVIRHHLRYRFNLFMDQVIPFYCRRVRHMQSIVCRPTPSLNGACGVMASPEMGYRPLKRCASAWSSSRCGAFLSPMFVDAAVTG